MRARIARVWLGLTVALGLCAVLIEAPLRPFARRLLDLFFFEQDLPILAAIALVTLIVAALPWRAERPAPAARAFSRPRLALAVLALGVGVIAYAGAHVVLDGYALSADEMLARFGAGVLAHGALLAPLPPAWTPFGGALQPMFMAQVPGGGFWAPGYLPVNAALIAIAKAAGDQALMGPVMAAVSVLAVFAVARRLWPQRPDAAWIAALLLATSSQLLVTAMTSYAMSAHLAFNLVWLWLFLRGGRWGHAGAIAVGALASGLHQLVFHPLFAAPFVLQLWLERRFAAALAYTLAYGAIGLFWMSYPALALHSVGVAAVGAGHVGAGGFVAEAVGLIRTFNIANLGVMARDLVRFATWQNPLTTPLALMALAGALRAKGPERGLAMGVGLTLAVLFVIMPYQGHGWGYRYLHGLMGSVSLLAAGAWSRFAQALEAADQAASARAFAAVAAISALVLLPLRAWQARAFSHPYAVAEAVITRAPTDLILVDDTGVWFGADLVRNDPYLANRPLTLGLRWLTRGQLQDLCARHTIAVFDKASAARLGIRTYDDVAHSPTAARLTLLRPTHCGPARPDEALPPAIGAG